MRSLSKELQKIQMVAFDRFMRTSKNPDEARLLSEASRRIPKDRRVVIVDSDLAYGNARALALDLNKVLDKDELLFLAYDHAGLNWAQANGLPAAVFSSKSESKSAELWDKLIRAKVSVYDTHNWWRTRDQLLQRSLLEGSFKIQLWHGAAGPIVKGVGLERLANSKTFWHFSAVATSSTGFDLLVNESREANFRSTLSIGARETIEDVEYRIVPELMNPAVNNNRKNLKPNLLIAPTYPENLDREDALYTWINAMVKAANEVGLKSTLRLHPGTSRRMRKKINKLRSAQLTIDASDSCKLSDFEIIVTDFSAIAHDALLLNLKLISIWTDLEGYRKLCPVRFDDDQKNVTYIINEIGGITKCLNQVVNYDPLLAERTKYAETLLSNLGAAPGVNTRDSVLAALNS